MKAAVVASALAAAALAGCASVPAPAPLPEPPLLRLAPAALGRELSQLQRLTVQVPGRAPQQAELLLEVDARAVRLAVLGLGRTAATLEWDGADLRQQRAPWWPAAAPAERILSELQFSLWPADAVRAALPAGWTLAEDAGMRTLSWQARPVLALRRDAANRSELVNERDGYRLVVESRDLAEPVP